jgi:hypothetical protein
MRAVSGNSLVSKRHKGGTEILKWGFRTEIPYHATLHYEIFCTMPQLTEFDASPLPSGGPGLSGLRWLTGPWRSPQRHEQGNREKKVFLDKKAEYAIKWLPMKWSKIGSPPPAACSLIFYVLYPPDLMDEIL